MSFTGYYKKERIRTGRRVIKPAWQLEESSYYKSKHMADNVYFGHKPKVPSPHYDVSYRGECIVRTSYKKSELNKVTGEHIGSWMFDLWKDSPGHYDIMMDTYAQNGAAICGYDYFATPYTPKFKSYISVYGTFHSGNTGHIIK